MSFATTMLRFSSPVYWVAIGFFALLMPLGPPTVRRLWSRKRRYDPPPGWPWGGPLWRGYTRSLLVSWMAMAVALVAVVVGHFAPDTSSSPLYWLTEVLAVSAAVAFLGLLPGVVLLSRPKCLIPPLLRSQPGALQEWLGRGRRKAAR